MGVLKKDDFQELAKIFATKDDLENTNRVVADILVKMGGLATRDDLVAAKDEIAAVAAEAFRGSPNRFEFHGHEVRLASLEGKVARGSSVPNG